MADEQRDVIEILEHDHREVEQMFAELESLKSASTEEAGVTEQRMFGGLAFLVGGNMAVAASGQGGLMVRVAPEETETLVREPHARPFEMRGREMRGWLRIDPEGVRTKRQLEPWVKRGVAYARSLPAKR